MLPESNRVCCKTDNSAMRLFVELDTKDELRAARLAVGWAVFTSTSMVSKIENQ